MDKVKELVDSFNGEIYDLCYELLDGANDATIFEFVCNYFCERAKEKRITIKSYISDSEIEEFESVYGDIVNGLLNTTIKKCNYGIINHTEFYRSLWASYCVNIKKKKELAFAFYYTLIDPTIPYQYLGKPISMSNERFKEIVEKNKDSIDKVKYIAKSQYSQRTEDASLLLNCLDKISDFESKTVVLAQAIVILSRFRSPRALDIDELIERIDAKADSEKE